MTRFFKLVSLVSMSAFAAACATPPSSCASDPDSCGSVTVDAGMMPTCGDHVCESTETVESCPQDCAKCGDGVCSSTETVSSCPQDCGKCGDGVCSSNETVSSCPQDCATCGDGVCSSTETVSSCPQDCAATMVVDNVSAYTIEYIYAWPCGDSNTFTNLLGSELLPNYHVTYAGISPGCWDWEIYTVNDAQTASTSVTLVAGYTNTWTID
jgi:hypothetical protein